MSLSYISKTDTVGPRRDLTSNSDRLEPTQSRECQPRMTIMWFLSSVQSPCEL